MKDKQFELFAPRLAWDASNEPDADENHRAGQLRRGSAGQLLVLADLQIRGFDAGELEWQNTDVIAEIPAGYMRRIQVKSATSQQRFGGNGDPRSRTLTSYKGKIDGFGFVNLPRRLVYYCHIDAIHSNAIGIENWSTAACDLSFAELLRRFQPMEREGNDNPFGQPGP